MVVLVPAQGMGSNVSGRIPLYREYGSTMPNGSRGTAYSIQRRTVITVPTVGNAEAYRYYNTETIQGSPDLPHVVATYVPS